MRTETLSSVTLATIKNYRAAAGQAARAYRAGSQRLLHAVNLSLEQNFYSPASKLAPQIASKANEMGAQVSELLIKGIDEVTTRTEKAFEFGADGAAKQVVKVAKYAHGIDGEMVTPILQNAARLSLPGVKVAMLVSGKLAEGAKALADAAAGKPVVTTAAGRVKRAPRKAARSVASVARKTGVRAKRKAA